MEKVHSADELMKYISNMDKENSVGQVFIPGKGKFTIVLQESEDENSIAAEVEKNPQLGKMIQESIDAYHNGKTFHTSELLKTLSPKDFSK